MDALRHLVANIPDWLKRLDELNSQIAQRQIELAQVTESSSGTNASAARSVRNRGSTESLKPNDDSAAHPHEPDSDEFPSRAAPPPTSQPAAAVSTTPPSGAAHVPPPSSPSGSNTPSALQRQTNQAKAQAQAVVRATLRKRQRTDSVVSAEGAAPKYRTRSLIIVYYDSYVQSFFEELVKFVSASRNMMRKAKMAAKVAQIKRMAEMEMGDEDDEDAAANNGSEGAAGAGGLTVDTGGRAPAPAPAAANGPAPNTALEVASGDNEEPQTLRYVSTRRMQPVTRTPNMFMTATGRPIYPRAGKPTLGGGAVGAAARGTPAAADQLPDVYDELDKGLEYVQGMCEHAAHQFLRDGDCGEEVANIQRRLGETRELADREMERVGREEPEALAAAEEAKGRSFRPQSMRREHSAAANPANPSAVKDGSNELEVDEAMADLGDGEMALPKLVYKSTRMMR